MPSGFPSKNEALLTQGSTAALSSTTLLANPNTTTTTPSSSSNVTTVTFSNTTATDNSTSASTSDLSNSTFYVPTAASASRQAGFLSTNATVPSDAVTSGWMFYGQVLVLVGDDGVWNTLFYAVAVDNGTDGLWVLDWNNTAQDTAGVPLTIKDNGPSNS